MVSHTMQGGCSCENAPGLRVRFSNMEIAAAAAPRPQILVSASGDWTRTTPEVEGPAIRRIYELLGVPDRLRYAHFDAGHNYNQRSREAVYAWFARWLLNQPDAESLPETPYKKEPDADLRVFPDGQPPEGALTMEQFAESLRVAVRQRWQSLVPRDPAGVGRFRKIVAPAWRATFQLDPAPPRSPAGTDAPRPFVLLAASSAHDGEAAQLADALRARGLTVRVWSPPHEPLFNPFTNFFTTYNRTVLQRRVGELVRECEQARRSSDGARIVLCGVGRAGLWALMAAPAADAVVADAGRLEVGRDEPLLEADVFCPGIRNIGTFEGAPMLAAPQPLLIHNAGRDFSTAGIRTAYRVLNAERRLRIEPEPLDHKAIAAWISRLRF
ncbi:MAG: hypothetical protein RMK20_07290 [Verrucomicrobiales bacterium]|nr:hypothetical protein [Verrucomicrobiales bacterium]